MCEGIRGVGGEEDGVVVMVTLESVGAGGLKWTNRAACWLIDLPYLWAGKIILSELKPFMSGNVAVTVRIGLYLTLEDVDGAVLIIRGRAVVFSALDP